MREGDGSGWDDVPMKVCDGVGGDVTYVVYVVMRFSGLLGWWWWVVEGNE